MPDWISKILQEWAVISAAPVSFFGTLFLLGLAVWGVIAFSYSNTLSSKNATIELLNGRLAAYQDKLKGASPEQAAGELATLRSELQAIKNPPRDPNGVYQRNRQIGAASGVQIDTNTNIATFQVVTVGGEIDQATNVEFRNLILAFIRSDTINSASQGLARTTTYGNARFNIVGRRSD